MAAEKKRKAEEVKAVKAAEKQAQKELRKAAKKEKEEQLRLRRLSIGPYRIQKIVKKKVRRPIATIKEEKVIKEIKTILRGRLVYRPKYLDS